MKEILREYSDQKVGSCIKALTEARTLGSEQGINISAVEKDLTKRLEEEIPNTIPEIMIEKKPTELLVFINKSKKSFLSKIFRKR